MSWPFRSAGRILVGVATVVAVAGLLVFLLPARSIVPLPQPKQPRPTETPKVALGLLKIRRRLAGWLPDRGLRSWLSPLYRSLFLKLSGYRSTVESLVADMVHAEDTVLDLGTGQGIIALQAARVARQVEATDSSPAMVDNARRLAEKRGHTNIIFRQTPATVLPYPDNTFSLVLSGLLLLAVPRSVRQQVLAEVFRVLKPDGRLAFLIGPADFSAVPMPGSQWQRFVERAGFIDVRADQPQSLFPVLRARKPLPAEEDH